MVVANRCGGNRPSSRSLSQRLPLLCLDAACRPLLIATPGNFSGGAHSDSLNLLTGQAEFDGELRVLTACC